LKQFQALEAVENPSSGDLRINRDGTKPLKQLKTLQVAYERRGKVNDRIVCTPT